jgi:hypothetical protein
MAKYKVGDKVVIRKDLVEDVLYYMEGRTAHNDCVDTMLELAEDTEFVTIIFAGDQYRVHGDLGHYGWVDEMFSGLYTGE